MNSYSFLMLDVSGPMEKKPEYKPDMKTFEIWVGYYHLGQGYHGSTKPELIATIESVNFKTACIKHELERKLKRIKEGELKGDLNSQDYPWWFNENTLSCSWLGTYYPSREEALKSFK